MRSHEPDTSVTGRRFVVIGTLLVLWAAVLVAIAVTVIPDAYWYSYYSVDYSVGFIRRGLAGELVSMFPPDQYFTALRIVRWLPTLFFTLGLAALAWTVMVRSNRSERGLMLASLIPVLPFGFAFGLFSSRPDLLGAALFAGFAIALMRFPSGRALLVVSAVYGVTLAVLTLAHEAAPFLLGLGALTALLLLAGPAKRRTLAVGAALAVGPGLVTAALVAALGRRGASAQLCERVPHGPTNHPLAGNPTPGQLLRGFRYEVDYHDWLCRNILPLYDQTFGDGMRFVGSIGPVGLIASSALGAGILVTTVLAISHVSGVSWKRPATVMVRRWWWVAAGVALTVPVFLSAVDWTRWWVMITYDLGVVFLLYTAGQPEVREPVSRRTRTVFAAGLVLLAVLPLGIIPGFGAPIPM